MALSLVLSRRFPKSLQHRARRTRSHRLARLDHPRLHRAVIARHRNCRRRVQHDRGGFHARSPALQNSHQPPGVLLRITAGKSVE